MNPDFGYVYFARPVGMLGPIKIGFTGNPDQRIDLLTRGSPFPIEYAVVIRGCFTLESRLRHCFADARSHSEWFHPVPRLLELIAKLKAGVPVQQAIDLSKRTGRLTRDSWSRSRRLQSSYHMRARTRLSNRECKAWEIINRWGKAHHVLPAASDLAILEAALGPPLPKHQLNASN